MDALDEISSLGKDLNFLPDTLPPGASALLTTRDNTKASQFMAHYCDNFKIRLNKLKEDEIPSIIKSDKANQKELFKLQKLAWEKSRGWPIIVADAARKAKSALDLSQINIDKTPFDLFERQASEWKNSSNTETLQQILLLLAVFEPACPLEITLVQGFIEHGGSNITQAQIRDLISTVGYQLEGVDEGKIKLGFKAFAEHIRDSHLSKKDMRNILELIVDWLAHEEDLDPKTGGLFLSYWADPSQVKDQRIQSIIESLIEQIENLKDADFVYNVARQVIRKFDKNELMLPYMEKLLRSAAEKGSTNALFEYGDRLLEGNMLKENREQGIYWLNKSAEQEFPLAMLVLGNRLLDGNKLEQDTKKGEQWLRKAAKNSEILSMRILGERLLDGDKLVQNFTEGEEWLRKAAEATDSVAMILLGIRLLDGDVLSQDLEEGEKWLRKAANLSDDQAMWILGDRLLDGNNLSQDLIEGEKWLRKAATAGNEIAMQSLGNRLLEGDGLKKDVRKGIEWLQKAADAGDASARSILGRYYYLKGDNQRATKYLLEAFDEGFLIAGNNLAYMIRRNEVPKNIVVPKIDVLLRELVETKDPFGIINKALCYSKGYQCKQDWQEADNLIGTIAKDTAIELLSWWHEVLQDDPEGHLVVGWLVRHGLVDEPTNLSITERFEKAIKGGWDVPKWMMQKIKG